MCVCHSHSLPPRLLAKCILVGVMVSMAQTLLRTQSLTVALRPHPPTPPFYLTLHLLLPCWTNWPSTMQSHLAALSRGRSPMSSWWLCRPPPPCGCVCAHARVCVRACVCIRVCAYSDHRHLTAQFAVNE